LNRCIILNMRYEIREIQSQPGT